MRHRFLSTASTHLMRNSHRRRGNRPSVLATDFVCRTSFYIERHLYRTSKMGLARSVLTRRRSEMKYRRWATAHSAERGRLKIQGSLQMAQFTSDVELA